MHYSTAYISSSLLAATFVSGRVSCCNAALLKVQCVIHYPRIHTRVWFLLRVSVVKVTCVGRKSALWFGVPSPLSTRGHIVCAQRATLFKR